jgi:hypothetical protein
MPQLSHEGALLVLMLGLSLPPLLTGLAALVLEWIRGHREAVLQRERSEYGGKSSRFG